MNRFLLAVLVGLVGFGQSLGPAVRCVCGGNRPIEAECGCSKPKQECCTQGQHQDCKQAVLGSVEDEATARAVPAPTVASLSILALAPKVLVRLAESGCSVDEPPRIRLPDLSTETLRAPPRFI